MENQITDLTDIHPFVFAQPARESISEFGFIGGEAGTGFEQEETEGTEIFFPVSVSSVCSC